MRVITIFLTLCILLPVYSSSAADTTPPPSNKWNSEFHLGITKALSTKNVTDCGQYRWQCDQHEECIVQCTSDGEIWRDYWVWPRTGGVDGPYPAGTAQIGK